VEERVKGAALAFAVLAVLLVAAPAAGGSVISWDGSGITTGAYLRPSGIAVDASGDVFVADGPETNASPAPRLVKFDADGVYLTDWQVGVASSLYNVATGPDGVFAVDPSNRLVKKYDSSGNAGTPAEFGSDQISAPHGLAVDSLGSAYVASSSYRKVVKFAADGTVIREWSLGSGPQGIAVGPNDDVFVAEYGASVIERFTATGVPVPGGSITTPFPYGVALDSDGNVYAINAGGVSKYDPAGALLGTWDLDLSQYSGIAVSSSRRVYVTKPLTGQVFRLAQDDESPTPSLTATPATPLATQLVTLDASASLPPRLGKIIRYEWDLDGDGTFETDGGTTPTITRRFSQVSTETVRVRVTGSTTSVAATKTLTLDVGQPPTVLVARPAPSLTGDEVSFDASGSAIPLSGIERYEWDLDGNGSFETDTGTSPIATHTYDTVGTPTIAVRVTRTGGRIDTATLLLHVRLTPPPGQLGMSINDGDFATNDPHVTLTLVWPQFAESALVSNDGGFGTAGSTHSFPVARHLSWTLPSARAERLPKTVYLRFRGGQSGAETYTDDIILDQGLPEVTFAQAAHRVLRVRARDGNTGVSAVIVKKPHARRAIRSKRLAPQGSQARTRVNTTVHLPRGLRRAYVRAVDAVGNKSRWRRITFR
jgi:sugar lactone lactonase YvrE/PKD repeat protein